jgi:hypothetical protein
MRNKKGQESVYSGVLVWDTGDQGLFIYVLFFHRLFMNIFPFQAGRANLLGDFPYQ